MHFKGYCVATVRLDLLDNPEEEICLGVGDLRGVGVLRLRGGFLRVGVLGRVRVGREMGFWVG